MSEYESINCHRTFQAGVIDQYLSETATLLRNLHDIISGSSATTVELLCPFWLSVISIFSRGERLRSRCVVNLMVQKNPALMAKPDKEHVVLLMPFFAEASTRLCHSSASPSMLTNSGGSGHRLFQRHSIAQRHTSDPAPQLAL